MEEKVHVRWRRAHINRIKAGSMLALRQNSLERTRGTCCEKRHIQPKKSYVRTQSPIQIE